MMLRPVKNVGVVARTIRADLIQPVDPQAKLNRHLPRKQQSVKLEKKELVGEARGVGLMGAVELVSEKETSTPFDPLGSAGPVLAETGHSEGIILRAIGDVLAVCPPLIIEKNEIHELFDRFENTLDKGLQAVK